uniref:Sieve element occlusion C-terminal domain-containing protein n=1 Tax=Kalanchoe fedtschenkoi TaxID=63787 RepID=A0A7N0TVQ0_KALFE
MVERVISPGMDEHTSTLFFLETLERRYYLNSALALILTTFAIEHGAWLLALISIFADSSEQEDINMVLKRVVSLTINYRGKAKTDAADCETGFCIYISLLSSTVRMPSDGWKSMESLYNLIRAMLEVSEVIRFLLIDRSCKSILRSLMDEFEDLVCLSLYWIVYGVTACSSQCNALPEKRVGFIVSTTLRDKMLLLLISGLDISSNEVLFLRDTYIESKTSVQQDYEIVWVPILSGQWTTSSEEKCAKLSEMMPWYMIEHPNFISKKTRKFIRHVWKFKRRPIMVAIDKNGDVVCRNVIHMMYIWGSKAFPFTPLRERTLWNSAETRLDSLVFDFDPNMSRMVEDGKWVILYGGNDVEWSRKFTTQVRKVLSVACILVEMIYVEENRELEPQSYSLYLRKVRYFWTRLESLLISRYQSFSVGDSGTDPILGEVKKMLSYKFAETWACIRTPSSDSMVHGLGDVMLQGFIEFEMWEQDVQTKEFAKEFQNHIELMTRGSASGHACRRIVLHTDVRDAVESLKCPSCDHSIEKKIRYGCCHIDELE